MQVLFIWINIKQGVLYVLMKTFCLQKDLLIMIVKRGLYSLKLI